ncbi:unnamed protein product [Lactuca virosa]|uniref:Serine carboxypeptidase-like 50 n=1 Tax=Lactuca virosa TaxID=75947 RepID=A0AAU9LL49_9ASTR|nr:unnamed protein product [Lactuca virosa]
MESTPLKLLLFLTLIHHLESHSSASTLPKEALPTKSGYLPVNSTTGSAIFYAFYEAKNTSNTSLSETPLVIWLQGGPGCSSMTGNFYELGPWRVTASVKQNVEHLTLEPNPGESYSGKYVPSIGYYILKKNPLLPASKRINLYGLAIGNGLTDPATQVATHALHSYNLGLINEKQKTQMEKLQIKAIELTKAGNWSNATDARNNVLGFLHSITGLATLYDFRRQGPYRSDWVEEFLKNPEVKKALGVNESMVFEECSDVVGAAVHEDVMKSVKYMVEFVVKNTKLLLYQGQCDLRDGVVSVESWVKKMKWEGIGKFLDAEKDVWRVNGVVAGYVQKWDNLSHVVVLGAGHFVPTDQNVNSQAMIENWVLRLLSRMLKSFQLIFDH